MALNWSLAYGILASDHERNLLENDVDPETLQSNRIFSRKCSNTSYDCLDENKKSLEAPQNADESIETVRHKRVLVSSNAKVYHISLRSSAPVLS